MRGRNLGAIAAVLTAVSMLAPARVALADGTTAQARALAETLFREGRKLMKEKRYAEACAKLDESYRLDEAAGTLLNLALCHEEEGKTATAWTELKESLYLAQKANRADRKKIAKEHLDKLEPRLSRLTLTLAPRFDDAEVEIRLDGVLLGEGALGSALPVDPGERVIRVVAPGKVPWEKTVTIGENADQQTIVIPILEAVPPPPDETPPPPPPPADEWQTPAALVAGGVGVVALGVGTFFGVRALSLGSESADHCPNNVCDAQGYEAYDDGRTSATIANIGIGVGVVGVVAGIVLFVTADDTPAQAEGLRVDVTATRASLSFGGGF